MTYAPTKPVADSLEFELLAFLADRPEGASFGEIRTAFPRGAVIFVLDKLVDDGKARRFEGAVFGITQFGRERLRVGGNAQ